MGRREDGSALLLMPAGVLVVVVLASIAVDTAIVFTAQRQLADAAAAAANDAVTAGLDGEAFYRCGGLALDRQRVHRIVAESLHQRDADIVDGVETVAIRRDASGAPTVTVTVHGVVETLFAPALPGRWERQPVHATATAVPVTAAPPPPPDC